MGDFDFDIDSDDTYASGYGRQGCGCGAFLVGALVVFIALVWLFHHKRPVELAVIVGCLVTVAYLGRGPALAFVRRPTRLDPKGLPTPLAKVEVGQSTHTAGLVGMNVAPMHAPLGAPPCVFFRIVIEPLDRPGAVIFEARSADEIVLEDGSGAKVIVRLDGVAWRVKRRHEIISSPSAPDEHVVTYLAERGIRVDEPVRAYVEWIAPHELVFVRGMTRGPDGPPSSDYRTSEAAPPIEVVASPGHPVVIALEPIAGR
jgi:hypothetical protein